MGTPRRETGYNPDDMAKEIDLSYVPSRDGVPTRVNIEHPGVVWSPLLQTNRILWALYPLD